MSVSRCHYISMQFHFHWWMELIYIEHLISNVCPSNIEPKGQEKFWKFVTLFLLQSFKLIAHRASLAFQYLKCGFI